MSSLGFLLPLPSLPGVRSFRTTLWLASSSPMLSRKILVGFSLSMSALWALLALSSVRWASFSMASAVSVSNSPSVRK